MARKYQKKSGAGGEMMRIALAAVDIMK